MFVGILQMSQKTIRISIPQTSLKPLFSRYIFWLRLSTIVFVPHDAIKKKPTAIVQHIIRGQEDKSRCIDSAVAQQLTAANAAKASTQKIFKNLLLFII